MRDRRKILSALMDVSDTLLSATVLWFCPRIFGVGFSVPLCFILTVALGFMQRLFDFNSAEGISNRGYLKRVIICESIFFSSLILISAFLRGGEEHSRVVLSSLTSALSLCTLIYLKKVAVLRLTRRTVRGRMIIVGDNAAGACEFVRDFKTEHTGYELVGALGAELADIGCRSLGDADELERTVMHERISAVVLAMREYDDRNIAQISTRLDELFCRVYFLPVMYGLIKSSAQLEYFGTTPLLRARASALELPIGAFLKRTLDILLSLFLMIITLPIMIFCAIGVKISLGRPIIFKQRRVGRYGEEFVMLKFRSMRDGAPCGFDGGSDTRKTRFGNFLRKTSLDELPQLLNVLKGEMSLVGPRPEIPFYVEKFRQEIPLYMLKHYAKPGITGLAQVKGYRGGTSLTERIKYDLFYIENWSLWLDIKILIMTPGKMINPNEIYKGERK
ncbi:MAG: exopolysaccharide biosynthesis polyprenyl glycosylphosphotransferase [Clostridia bacterium]|nr:exopolysaccharide biosynthesis polyprenyl glycosylphosphotransferase [Clostridia bacterium]